MSICDTVFMMNGDIFLSTGITFDKLNITGLCCMALVHPGSRQHVVQSTCDISDVNDVITGNWTRETSCITMSPDDRRPDNGFPHNAGNQTELSR